MSANTACTILFQDGLTAAEATGAFDIAYCLPIYDNRTDGDVMQSPVENSASETADAADPDDFHGFAFPKLSSGAYSLVEWSESEDKVVAYAADSGWAVLPPYSQEVSVDGYDAVGALNGAVKKGATISNGSLTGTPGTYDSLSSWNLDDLYKSVVYLGSKENDDGWKSAYGIHLTCRDPNGSSASEFVPGGIRFNKVLVFQQGTSGVVPVAMVCLPSPVVIAANVAGVANSITINFNFGYDTTLTPQAASFDNTYWSKLPDTSEPVVPLYTPSRVVIGGNEADEVVAENAAITIYEKTTDADNSVFPKSISVKAPGSRTMDISAYSGIDIVCSAPLDGKPSVIIRDDLNSVQPLSKLGFSFGYILDDTGLDIGGSFVQISQFEKVSDGWLVYGTIGGSLVIGDDASIAQIVHSIYIANQNAYGNEKNQAVRLNKSILIGDTNGIVKLHNSILVGDNNYHGIWATPAAESYTKHDNLCNSLIVGNSNVLGRSAQDDADGSVSAKPVVILGHDNSARGMPGQTGKFSVYIFGSNNEVQETIANAIPDSVYGVDCVDVPRFVFGNGVRSFGWKYVAGSTTYGDTEYNHVFDFVIPQHALVGTAQFTDPLKDAYLGGTNAGGISVGFIPSTSTSANEQYLVIDTHYIAATTSGNVYYGGMRLPHYKDLSTPPHSHPLEKDGLIYCMDKSDLTPATFTDFLNKLAYAAFNGYFPLLVKMPTT